MTAAFQELARQVQAHPWALLPFLVSLGLIAWSIRRDTRRPKR